MSRLTSKLTSRAEYALSFNWDDAKIDTVVRNLLLLDQVQYQSGFLALAPDIGAYLRLKEFAAKMNHIAQYANRPPHQQNQQTVKSKHENRLKYVKDNIDDVERWVNQFEISIFRAYRSYLLKKCVSKLMTLATKHEEVVHFCEEGDVFIKKDTLKAFKLRAKGVKEVCEAYDSLTREKLDYLKVTGELFSRGCKIEKDCNDLLGPFGTSVLTHYDKVLKYYEAQAKLAQPAPVKPASKFLYPGQLIDLLTKNQATVADGTGFDSNQTNPSEGEYSRRYVITGTSFVIHGHYRSNGKLMCNLHIKHVSQEMALGMSTWVEKYWYGELIKVAPNVRVPVTDA